MQQKFVINLVFQKITSSDDPIDKKMNWKQVYEAGKSDFLNIGGHSHTHQILSFLDSSQLAYELDTSINLLKDKADIKPTHYSYPEGLEHCYSENVINELRKRELYVLQQQYMGQMILQKIYFI